jgi:hypothetical protein
MFRLWEGLILARYRLAAQFRTAIPTVESSDSLRGARHAVLTTLSRFEARGPREHPGNLQRADVHELDEAQGYAALMRLQPEIYTVETISAR